MFPLLTILLQSIITVFINLFGFFFSPSNYLVPTRNHVQLELEFTINDTLDKGGIFGFKERSLVIQFWASFLNDCSLNKWHKSIFARWIPLGLSLTVDPASYPGIQKMSDLLGPRPTDVLCCQAKYSTRY